MSYNAQRENPLLIPIIAAISMIGPFTIDTYLPSFHAVGLDLHASQLQVQQTLTAYLLPFTFMILWHGAVADAYGRRRTLLWGFGLYTLASLFCAFALRIEMLWLGRALQGMSAGVGMVVGRAIIRDVFDGPQAQKQMAHVALLFALAPALAPILGGWIQGVLGWRAVFGFLVVFGVLIWLGVYFFLPETLNPDHVQSLQPRKLWRSYRQVFGNLRFFGFSAALGMIFNGMFLYILSAPVFILEHLRLTPQSFGWLFIPNVGGMMVGAWISGRLAGKLSPNRTVAAAFALMLLASTLNVGGNCLFSLSIPWVVLPLPLFTCGMGLAMPSLQLVALDLFPQNRGLASSCQGVIQTSTNTLTAAVIAPLMWGSTLMLAVGMAGFALCGGLCFLVARRARSQI